MRPALQIVFQDDTLLAICKPSGLLSVPDRFNKDLVSATSLVQRDFPEARPLHRLDVQTSGILLFSLHSEAFGFYSDQFADRTVSKAYLAIAEGRFREPEGHIDLPLLTEPGGRVVVSKRGKACETLFAVQSAFRQYTLLSLRPLTGRTHQIRVHLAAIGHPILGDTTYGGHPGLFLSDLKGKHKYKLNQDAEKERPLIGRTALHAESITLQHYPDGAWLTLACPLPKDMAVGLAKLQQFQST